MIEHKTYSLHDINFTIDDLNDREEPTKVLLSSPEYFDIIDVKNIHMKNQQGQLDKKLALEQWNELKKTYDNLTKTGAIDQVHVLPGAPSCEDMVFAANQSFPWKIGDKKIAVMSKMYHDSRRREVQYFEQFYKSLGYEIKYLTQTDYFEGMGDTIPHPHKNLLYGGYGHRSTKEAYTELSSILKVPIITLELRDERFYHLDTCFVPLDSHTLLVCREAFADEGWQAIHKLFRKVISIPIDEAQYLFSLNAHVLNISSERNKTAILQKGSIKTATVLKELGFSVIELDTSEYMKSGGSVFCMKMMLY